MNEELKHQLSEWLASEGVEFEEVTDIDIDPDTATFDIGYRKRDGRWGWFEVDEIVPFLEFLLRPNG